MARERRARRHHRTQGVVLLCIMSTALVLATAAVKPFVPPAAQPRIPAAPQLLLPLGLVEVLSLSPPANAEINLQTYGAAAGVDPGTAREMLIDENASPAEAVGLAFVDFIFDTVLPFSIAFGAVYVFGVATGLTESPFGQQEDKDKAKDSKS
eukprot:TRINITY_DN107395_c0_g1_i1.p1 TRINITY_DN107395_c0_g1~~TRINITY_DN107395_c0_g1_i1.p1  ORF type:complete len:153 (+),score=40.53 TRINITY_DN107395_c0_g1_i1:63-521(+)